MNFRITLSILLLISLYFLPCNSMASTLHCTPPYIIRGFNIDTKRTEKDFQDIANLKANALRVSFVEPSIFLSDGAINSEAVGIINKYLSYAEMYNIGLIIDLHYFPGNTKKYSGSPTDKFWNDSTYQKKLALSTALLIRNFSNNFYIYAFDIINEPAAPESHLLLEYLSSVIKYLQAWNIPLNKLMIQPPIKIDHNGIPTAQYKSWNSIDTITNNKIIKSLHYYEPGSFTHQGVAKMPKNINLPFYISSPTLLDIYHKKNLDSIEWPRLIIGEFSVANFAETDEALLYLQSSINYFENRKWSWFYHAFRESSIWSPEIKINNSLISNDNTESSSTPRIDLLKIYFSRNRAYKCTD